MGSLRYVLSIILLGYWGLGSLKLKKSKKVKEINLGRRENLKVKD